MESSNVPPPAPKAPSTLKLTAQHGIDMLWRYQLRKESAALLEKLDANKKVIEDISSETSRKLYDTAERISTLEAKLLTIDNEGKKLREAKQKWDEDVASLKAQMGIIPESQIPESQVPETQTIPKLSHPSTFIDAPRPVEDARPHPNPTSLTTMRLARTDTSTTISDDNLAPTPVSYPDTIMQTIENNGTIIKFTEGPRTRSRSKLNRPTTANGHSAEAPKPANSPRLIQGTNSLTTYHKNACTAFASIPKDRLKEIEFIGHFIKGIQELQPRNALVGELQKAHPCRTNKDGKVEVLCEWADVAEGLNKVGLLSVESGEGAPQSQGVGKKKKKILIPREYIESGMMR